MQAGFSNHAIQIPRGYYGRSTASFSRAATGGQSVRTSSAQPTEHTPPTMPQRLEAQRSARDTLRPQVGALARLDKNALSNDRDRGVIVVETVARRHDELTPSVGVRARDDYVPAIIPGRVTTRHHNRPSQGLSRSAE
jgi:hypothetical protein